MAVSFDVESTTAEAGFGTGDTLSITLGSGANCAVVLYLVLEGVDFTGFAATIGGEAFVLKASSTYPHVYVKPTTLTGAQTISVSWTNNQRYSFYARAYTGVDPATPTDDTDSNSGASPLSITLTSAVGEITTTLVYAASSHTQATTNQTFVKAWDDGNSALSVDEAPGAASTTHTWTHGSVNLAIAGISLKAAAEAGSTLIGAMSM